MKIDELKVGERRCDSKIAIIIPCYNAEKTIEETLESVLAQTYQSFQIYAVNDGSTDNTLSLLNEYKKRYFDKVCIISQKNQGQSKARNTAINESFEEFIAFIDSDDQWHKKKLEKQVALLEQNKEIGLLYTQGIEIDDKGNELGVIKVNPLYRGRCFQNLVISNNIVASSVILKRSVINETGIFDTQLGACENWDLWLRISKNFFIDFLDEPLTYYRIHSNNMSQNSKKMYENRELVLRKHLLDPIFMNEFKWLINRAFHKHHKLYGLKLIDELQLIEARKELLKALKYNYSDIQLYKLIMKSFLNKNFFLRIRKIKMKRNNL